MMSHLIVRVPHQSTYNIRCISLFGADDEGTVIALGTVLPWYLVTSCGNPAVEDLVAYFFCATIVLLPPHGYVLRSAASNAAAVGLSLCFGFSVMYFNSAEV